MFEIAYFGLQFIELFQLPAGFASALLAVIVAI